jgi:hypothetical protein
MPQRSTPRFTIVAYTGEAMSLAGFDLPLVVDCATLDVSAAPLPALLDHMPYPDTVVGQIDAVSIDGANRTPPVTCSGFFTPTGSELDAARVVMDKADAGYQWQASVGGDPKTVERIEAGATGEANGRTYPGPCYIARGMVLREVSFVVLGGDRFTAALMARHRAAIKGSSMNPTYEEWLASLGFSPEALDETQSANLKLLYQEQYPEGETEEETEVEEPAPAEPAAAAQTAAATAAARPPAVRAAANPVADMNRQAAANSERIGRINALAEQHGNPQATYGGRQTPIAAHAIRNNWTADRAELEMIRASRPNPQPARAGGDDAASRLHAQTVGAAVCITAGVNPDRVARDIPQADRERVMNEAQSAQFRGFGIQSLMDATIRAAGRQYHGSRRTNDYVRAALEADRSIRTQHPGVGIRASQGFTTVSLSGILGNVANKVMIAAYEAQMTTWQQWAAVRSYGDFKTVSSYRLDMTGAFKKVGPDGELKHVGMEETGYTNQLATYGAIVALTRQMQINDDLNAFTGIPAGLGRMSAIRVEEAAYVTLLSNPSSFFAAGNGNLITGGGTALSVTSLTTAETAFGNQVDTNGKPILTMPNRLLVGTALGVTARNLYNETALGVATGEASTSTLNMNPHAGKYVPVISPYLNNTAIRDQDGVAVSGQSATQWYLFADPAVRAAVVVGFLNGQQTPTIEDADTDFATLGHQWRAYHDFGVGMEDVTAALKSAGA